MNCPICGCEIDDSDRFCPSCGRIITSKDRELLKEAKGKPENGDIEDVLNFTGGERNEYRPYTEDSMSDDTIKMTGPDAFRSLGERGADANMGEALRLTEESEKVRYKPISDTAGHRDYSQRPYDIPPKRTYERVNREPAREAFVPANGGKPVMRSNAKAAIGLATVVFIVLTAATVMFGIKMHKKRIEAANETTTEATDMTSEETTTKKATAARIGLYTVTSNEKNIVMYKTSSGESIFASIPNGTVIEITRIESGYGETKYADYSGWVNLSDLRYTPEVQVNADVSQEG